MKFGKEIQKQCAEHPCFGNFFLDYKELKRTIKSMRMAPGKSAEESFRELLRQQLEKVNNFVELQWEVTTGELRARQRTNAALSAHALDGLAKDLLELHNFVHINSEGFRKITKKCDKHCGLAISTWFMPLVESASFRQWDFDAPLTQLSKLHAKLREKDGDDRGPTWNSEQMGTEVFLVPRTHAMATKVVLSQFLTPCHSGASESSSSRRPSKSHPKRFFSETYFDSPEAEVFKEQWNRRFSQQPFGQQSAVGSSSSPAFRFRWVGQTSDPDVVTLEVSYASGVHHEVQLKLQEAASLVHGGSVMPGSAQSEGAKQALADVLRSLRDRKMSPKVSMSFRRSTFHDKEMAEGVDPCAVIDEDLLVLDELFWNRRSLPSSERLAVPFPYAFLRLQRKAPSALRELLIEKVQLEEAPGLSKFLGAMLLMHKDFLLANGVVEDVSNLFDRASGRNTAPEKEPSQRLRSSSDSLRPKEPARVTPVEQAPREGHVEGSRDEPAALQELVSPARVSLLTRVQGFCRRLSWSSDEDLRVDSKVPLSNERTVLRWFRCAVLLSALSAFLTSREGTSNQLNGVLLGGVAVLFGLWPLSHFYHRSLEMAKPGGGQPESDRTIPQALAWSLAAILASVLVVQASVE